MAYTTFYNNGNNLFQIILGFHDFIPNLYRSPYPILAIWTIKYIRFLLF